MGRRPTSKEDDRDRGDESEGTPGGLEPAGEGWFVVNVRDTAWVTHAAFGDGCVFESRGAAPFPELGINISVLQPGQPVGLYHEEGAQEDFLVLAGEVLLLVNGEERALRAWDFFHSPARTEHVVIGAGDGHSILLAVGARHEPGRIRYPVSAVAARHGASAQTEAIAPQEVYATFEPTRPGRPDSWSELPWVERGSPASR
ncbi:MAG TPA: cupin domain-containing protein [Gaiellales bacterium]